MIKLSIIIPTRNRARLLEKTLDSLTLQTIDFSLFEILVIDNGSIDDTHNVYLKYKEIFDIKYFYELQPGLHIGRNKGYQIATGNLLVFIDDDIIAFPKWLETINEVFADEDVYLVTGKNLPNWECPPPQWLLNEWEKKKDNMQYLSALSISDLGENIKEINPHFVWGCNFSVRKQLLHESKGFHPDGMPKELIYLRGDGESHVSQVALSLSRKAVYHPEASVYHWVSKERMTDNYFFERNFNQGISDSYTYLRNKPTGFALALKNCFAKSLKFVKKAIKKFLNNSQQLSNLERNNIDAYLKGYKFHQKMYKTNNDLRIWVHKENY